MLSNILRLTFWHPKTIGIIHPRYHLIIDFQGTILRGAFFRGYFFPVRVRLFERENFKLIPRWGDSINYTIFGMVASNSILNCGPVCYFLQQWFYEATTDENDQEKLLDEMTLEDIPLNSSSSTLVDFLKNMDLIKTQEEIDKIVDQNIQILNSSTWDPTVQKYWKLISKVIFDELFLKRNSQLKSICERLELSRLLSYIRKYPIFCRKIFVANLDPLTAQNLLDTPIMENEETFEKKQPQFFFFSMWKRQTPISCRIFHNLSQALPGFRRGKWKKVLF